MSKMIKYIDGNLIEYEILKLVDEYDPILRQPTKPVLFAGGEDDMKPSYLGMSLAETLAKSKAGLGLAANQVGLPYRAFAMNTGDKIWIFLNPKITWLSEEVSNYKEGCLSFPGLYLQMKRPASVEIEFQAMGGEVMKQQFDGLTARIVLHEMDHLDGVCFTDKISKIKLSMAKDRVQSNLRKIKKMSRNA